MNGVLLGKADRLGHEDGPGEPDEYGWWADVWMRHGERKLAALKSLVARGAELYGSSYAYPPLVKRGKGGHIDRWPFMVETLSTTPQNHLSAFRTSKAVLDVFDQADITVSAALRDVLAELDGLRDLSLTFGSGEGAAKAGRELSGANLAAIEAVLNALQDAGKSIDSLVKRVRSKYQPQTEKEAAE